MSKVIMKKTKEGAPDGINLKVFESGKEYKKEVLGDFLYNGWKKQGVLEDIQTAKFDSDGNILENNTDMSDDEFKKAVSEAEELKSEEVEPVDPKTERNVLQTVEDSQKAKAKAKAKNKSKGSK